MNQKERQERSKKEIYQAALIEFGTYGYNKVTVDSICSTHHISKGMMYHYYVNKDDLFLLCVKNTFSDLKNYIEQQNFVLTKDVFENIKNYFMIREYYFQDHPLQKRVFESAVLRTPKHLSEQIQILRTPLKKMNRDFLSKITAQMKLRSNLDAEKVMRYLEGIEYHFWTVAEQYEPKIKEYDIHTMLKTAEELLDMILFGVLKEKDS